MYLQKVEIQGFKSFARKTVLTFPPPQDSNKGVTAIVGPNGSGKSNISDAIRWVLGEQSMKSIRGKRSEDVIFFGSMRASAMGMSEVSLTFNNEDHGFPLDYSEVVITRRLYRSGESEYLINKNKVRLSDLILLLAQARIGQRSYCIVSQGMIDAILMASPSERKGYFDDAAGIREYQIKRDSSLLKLHATQENLTASNLHLKEIEPKIRFLERQMKRKEQRAGLEKEYGTLIRAYYTSVWDEYDEKKKTVRATHDHFVTLRSACEQEIRRLEGQLSTYQKSEEGEKKDVASLQDQLDALLARKNTLHAELAVAQSRRGSKEQKDTSDAFFALRMNEITEEIRRMEGKQTSLQDEVAKLAREEKQATEELAVFDREHEKMTSASLDTVLHDLESLASLEEQVAERDSYEKAKSFIEQLFGKIRSILETVRLVTGAKALPRPSSPLQESRQKRDTLLSHIHEVRARARRIEQELASLAADYKQKTTQLQTLRASRGNAEDHVKAYETELQDIEGRIEKIRSRLYREYAEGEEARDSLIALQKDLQERTKEFSSLQQQENDARVELAKIETKLEELAKTICDEFRIPQEERYVLLSDEKKIRSLFESPAKIENREEARRTIERLKKNLEAIGAIDEEALAEYSSIQERYQFLSKQTSDMEETAKKLEGAIAELDAIMEDRFSKSMRKINEKFQEYFSSLFNGGNARITILNAPSRTTSQEEENEEAEKAEEVVSGIDIEASPPGKKLKSISLLSGGERALTAIALLCAILSTNPSPFVVLDEVDAALDESNALRFAHILEELVQKTQFVIITHSRVTIHTAQVLYGATMGDDGISHVVSLDVTRAHGTIAQSLS